MSTNPPEREAAESVSGKSSDGQLDSHSVRKLRRASMVSLLTYGFGHVLRLGSNLVMTRLLFEEAFAVMALVSVFLQGLQLISDIGLRPAIMQNPRGNDPAFVATAFTLQVARGVILFIVSVLAARPFATFYNMPELAVIVPVAGFTAIIQSLTSMKTITLERELSIGRLAILGILSQILGLVTTVIWALYSPSVWALVFGSAMHTIARTVLSHIAVPGRRDYFDWNRGFVREILSFGRWVSLSTLLSFLANQSDRLILGKLLTATQLGVYNIALVAATLPSVALAGLSQSVLFPVLSRVFERREEISRECRRLRRPILLLGGYMTSGLAGGATLIVDLLYDDRYLSAGPMLGILGTGGWISIVEVSAMYSLLACGMSGWMAWSSAVKLLGTSIMIPAGYALDGINGALVGFVVADLAKYVVVIAGLRRVGIRIVSQDITMSVLWATAAGVAAITSIVSEPLGRDFSALALRSLIIFLLVSAIWLPAALRYRRDRSLENRSVGRPQ